MTDAPVFVVGLPRSGTTLLATMLSSHPRIDCGPETYFFRWLPKDPSPLLDERSWPDAATDFVCDLRPKSEPKVHELFGLTREQVREELSRREPSVAAMLESLTATHARVAGKARWAEKSPGHLTHLPLIRRTYPDAAFVRIVRDPRDTAMSMTRVHWASDSLVVDLYEVAMRDRRFDGPARRDPRLITVRFEDLVTDPEAVLRSICGFVGEKYSGEMLAPKERPATLGGDEEWWKQKAAERPDPSRVGAWQREMDPLDQRAAAVICHEVLARHRYPGGVAPVRTVAIEPDGPAGFVRRQERVVRDLAIEGTLVVRGGSRAGPRPPQRVFWGRPVADAWQLGRSPMGHARRLARMAALLVRDRLARRPALWVTDGATASGGRIPRALLRTLARQMTVESWLSSMDASPRRDPVPVEPPATPAELR